MLPRHPPAEGGPAGRLPWSLYPAFLLGSFHLTWPPVLSVAMAHRLVAGGTGGGWPGAELWLGIATLAVAPFLVVGAVRRRIWAWSLLLIYLSVWTGLYAAAGEFLDERAWLPAALMLAAAILTALPPSRVWFDSDADGGHAGPVLAGKPRLKVLAGGRSAQSDERGQ